MDQQKSQDQGATTSQMEYIVRIPEEKHRHFNVMRFNHSHKVDVNTWTHVKMERENNLREFKLDDDNPKFGAGSEFGRDLKEEARRRKHGIVSKQYNPEDQPWLLRVGGKGGRRFKGIREGGITENASYYVFTQASEGVFEAHPVKEWYNFTPIRNFKALSAEEAEEEFGKRDKVMNFFSIMVKKKLQTEPDDDDEEDKKPGVKKKKKARSSKDFKITDMDDWVNDVDDSGDSNNEPEDGEDTNTKKGPKKGGKKKKSKKSDDEAMEESDEGDFDDREVDYITSSSGSDGEELGEEEKANRELKGVEDEDAIRKLMSDEEEEEEDGEEEAEKEATEETPDAKEKEQKSKQKQKKSDSSGESSSESSDSDFDDPKFTSAIFVSNFQKSKKKSSSDNSASSSRANTPTKEGQKGLKRKLGESPAASTSTAALKKPKVENGSNSSTSSSASTLDGINEETVRRYLSRKPMTASELLHKFKSKKTKMSSDQLVTRITDVLKRIPLQKTNIKGKMYLSLKALKEA